MPDWSLTILLLTDHQLVGLFEELCRDRAVQLPCDVHGAGALVLHIVHRPQIGIRSCTAKTGICLELAHEQQYPASLCTVMDVALPGGRVFGGGALALPVEQAFVDGIILVHSGGRVILVCFVQGHKEYVQLLFRQPLHALADGSGLQKVQRYQQLVAGIGAVQQ